MRGAPGGVRMRRWAMLAAGWGLVGLGVLGLVLPVLQGVLFLAIGGTILANESPWVRVRLYLLKRRYPQVAARFDRVVRRARQRGWIR
ncbi:MAG: hypothetical protein FD153_2087 [Rhodospirillaceae bacterium]|nr:MAG: hypothetical protein FD153_2087 [Rhodospirillaceae bacterium]